MVNSARPGVIANQFCFKNWMFCFERVAGGIFQIAKIVPSLIT